MAYDNDTIKTSLDVINREIKCIKGACGLHDHEGDEETVSDVDAGDSEKERPRKRGRHKKGMPSFKKGEE